MTTGKMHGTGGAKRELYSRALKVCSFVSFPSRVRGGLLVGKMTQADPLTGQVIYHPIPWNWTAPGWLFNLLIIYLQEYTKYCTWLVTFPGVHCGGLEVSLSGDEHCKGILRRVFTYQPASQGGIQRPGQIKEDVIIITFSSSRHVDLIHPGRFNN